jgi:hypothetical protein
MTSPPHTRWSAARLVLVALPLAACLKPNPLALELATDEEASETSESEAGGSSESADVESSESADVESGDGSDGSDGSEGASDMPGDLPDTSGDCSAPPEFAPECATCLTTTCCTSLVPCAEDFVCVCLADCLFAGGSNNECRMLCGEKPADVEPLAPLLSCAARDCPICSAA